MIPKENISDGRVEQILTMLRGPAVLVGLVVILLIVLLLGFNSYHNISVRLKVTEDYAEEVKIKYKQLVKQTHLLQDEKHRLNERYEATKEQCRQDMEDLRKDRKTMGENLAEEKMVLTNLSNSQKDKILQLEMELSRARESLVTAQTEMLYCRKMSKREKSAANAREQSLQERCLEEKQKLTKQLTELERGIGGGLDALGSPPSLFKNLTKDQALWRSDARLSAKSVWQSVSDTVRGDKAAKEEAEEEEGEGEGEGDEEGGEGEVGAEGGQGVADKKQEGGGDKIQGGGVNKQEQEQDRVDKNDDVAVNERNTNIIR